MKENKDINSNFFDLYEFSYSILNKWYLYLIFILFVIGSFITKSESIYKMKITPIYGPKAFVFRDLIKKEKSISLDLKDERLYDFIKDKMSPSYLNSFEISNLINDIIYLKNINSKENINFDLTSIRLPLFDYQYYEEFFSKKIASNPDLKEKYNIKIGKSTNHFIYVSSLVNESNKEKLEATYNQWIKEIYKNYENSLDSEYITFPSKNKWITVVDKSELSGIVNFFENNLNRISFFIGIFLILIIINLIINFFDKKVYSISRVSNYLDFKVDMIINYKNLKELSDKLSKLNQSSRNYKLYFLASKKIYKILNKNIPLFNNNQLFDIDKISKDIFNEADANFIFLTGYALNSSYELIEINSIFKTYLVSNNLKVIYISKFIHNL